LNPNQPRIHPYLGIGVGVLAASTASIFIRYAQADGAPSLVIAAARLTIAAVILLPPVFLHYSPELTRLTRRDLALVAASGAFLALHFATWISSLAYTSVANSTVFVTTSPLFVALIAASYLHEKLTPLTWLGIGLALAGSLIVGLSDACAGPTGCPSLSEFVRDEGFYGDMLALAGAGAIAVYYVLGRSLRGRMSLIPYIFLTYGSGALVMIGTVLVSRVPFEGIQPRAGAWLLSLALVPQLIGHSSFNWALKYLPATFVAVTVLGEPIGSVLLAFLLLGETPSLFKLIGGALILGGIVAAARRES
jgi:drug/metabolite transporter (DMT)-like permease